MAPLGWLAAKLAGAHLVMQMHGIEAWPRPSNLARRACESAALILNVFRYTRSRVLDWAAIPPERALALPNTVAECFSPGDGSALCEEWDIGAKKALLTVGRMATSERYKGHDRVIAALPELLAGGHDVVYVVAGEGDDVPHLQKLAHEAGVRERVRFVGALSRERLVEAYRLADLFLMLSSGEGFGIAFLEAVACGAPTLGLELGVLTTPLPIGNERVRELFGREALSSRLCSALPVAASTSSAAS
jgi:phosphatidylinositol alpha-1,6-mannosyltransferase